MSMCKSASPGRYVTLYTAIAFASMTTSLSAAEFGPPPNAELSLDKLSKIDDFINDQVAKGNIPGAVVLIQLCGDDAGRSRQDRVGRSRSQIHSIIRRCESRR